MLPIKEFSENLQVHTDWSDKLGKEQSELLGFHIVISWIIFQYFCNEGCNETQLEANKQDIVHHKLRSESSVNFEDFLVIDRVAKNCEGDVVFL